MSEASVVIAVSSAHRAASLAAVSYAIDALKAKVPIWKKVSDGNAPLHPGRDGSGVRRDGAGCTRLHSWVFPDAVKHGLDP